MNSMKQVGLRSPRTIPYFPVDSGGRFCTGIAPSVVTSGSFGGASWNEGWDVDNVGDPLIGISRRIEMLPFSTSNFTLGKP